MKEGERRGEGHSSEVCVPGDDSFNVLGIYSVVMRERQRDRNTHTHTLREREVERRGR